jgi:AbrB family looped-hinge helix DNA binding protein
MNNAVRVSLDESGRIIIPPSLRKQLRLEPGMTLVVEKEEEGGVCLRVQAEPTTLVEKDGLLVARVTPLEDLGEAARRERDRRAADLLQRAGL